MADPPRELPDDEPTFGAGGRELDARTLFSDFFSAFSSFFDGESDESFFFEEELLDSLPRDSYNIIKSAGKHAPKCQSV